MYVLLWVQPPRCDIAGLGLDMVLEGATWRSLDIIRELNNNSMLWMLMVPVFELTSRISFVYLSKDLSRDGTEGGFCSRAASLTWNLCSMAACFFPREPFSSHMDKASQMRTFLYLTSV